MERFLLIKLTEEEDRIGILKLRAIKKSQLKHFSYEVKNTFIKLIDELICEVVFRIHMELNIKIADLKLYRQHFHEPNRSLVYLAQDLNIIKVNQDVDCPKCFVLVKCLWLSKHLAGCINPEKNNFSYSSRSSSRIARQRIQEGFKTCYDECKTGSNNVRMRSKRKRKTRSVK